MSLAAYFNHTSCNGRQFTDRARAQGTATTAENIAFGQTTPVAAVQAWMSSTSGHCDAIMSSRTIVGIGYARVGNHSWVANFR
jgi:uncharacterized protein YkwD